MNNDQVSKDGRHILIIEDDENIRNVMKYALENEGYLVKEATNGKEGIEQLKNETPPCLILLDLMMPEMNGWQFMAELGKTMFPKIVPVVIVSAFADQGKDLKVKAILKKPINLDLFLETVKDWCAPLKPVT